MLDVIKKKLSSFWKNHISANFSDHSVFPYDYDDECFMCNKGSCTDCPLLKNKLPSKNEEGFAL